MMDYNQSKQSGLADPNTQADPEALVPLDSPVHVDESTNQLAERIEDGATTRPVDTTPATINGSTAVPADRQLPLDFSLPLSRSEGGISNTALQNWTPTFKQLCEELQRRPEVGDKDGPYFVRGPFVEGHPTRADANIQYASLIVLDGDSSINPETGETTEGAPPPELVHRALAELGINHVIHPSYSNGLPEKGYRFRVLISVHSNDAGELKGYQRWIFHLLHSKGCWLANVKENGAWSQAWFFPRLARKDSVYEVFIYDAGPPFDTEAAKEWLKAETPFTLAVLESVARPPKPRDPNSVYSQFNTLHGTPAAMLELLKRHGYVLKSMSEINDQVSYRLLSPHSKSGSAGIVLFCGNDGTWLVYSHHGSGDPLSKDGDANSACDAFDLSRILEHKGDEQDAIAAWERTTDSRPVIQIKGGALSANLKDAIQALVDLEPPRVYQRAHELSRIAHFKEAAETEGCTIPAGTAHIVPLQKPILSVILSDAIRWEAFKKKKWRIADPCQKVAGALLGGFGLWGGIPSLLGISEAPILRADGTLLSDAGYDRETGLYVEGNAPELYLPDTITLEDAQASARALLEPFAEFPFVDKELDPAVLLALLLTLALRPQLSTAPMFAISATTPGTGKGLLVEVANLLVRGRDAATMPPVQGSAGEEEMRKRLTALLIQGIPVINMDNVTRAIGGESINALLTTTEWTDRVLSRSVSVTVPARCTILATGNNVTVKGDTTRRAMALLLDAKVERPELRTFKEKDLPARVLRERGVLLQHLFTILKGYQQAGSPGSDENLLGRFEAWTARVCGPIRWLGYPDPLESQQRLRELDPETDRLSCLLEAWWEHMSFDWHSAGDLIKAADTSNGFQSTLQQEALRSALRDVAAEGRDGISSKLLGWYLNHNEGRIVEVFRLERKPRQGTKSRKAQQYRVVNTTLLV